MSSMGLTSREASELLLRHGPNRAVEVKRVGPVRALLARFTNPLIIILLLAGAGSAFFGDRVSFIIIITIVAISVLLDFVQTYRSGKAAEALQAKVRIHTEVIRDGVTKFVPVENIVPGDLVQLRAGNVVPADGVALGSKDLFINEAALTGESFPQSKEDGSELFMGSSVVSGRGILKVQVTGSGTKFAHVAAALAKETPTEFDQELRDFSLLIVRITFFLVVLIFGFNSLLKHDLLESLLFSLALAVGLTPELLPLIVSLNLTKGSLVMAGHGVIVKKLSAIQNFGSMDVLCTDKTGTLTEDRIDLVKYVDGFGVDSEDVLLHAYILSVFSTSYESPLNRAIKEYRKIPLGSWQKMDEIPFDFERKRESVVATHNLSTSMITMGAPEAILEVSSYYDDHKPLSDSVRDRITDTYEQLSRDGFRILAVANKKAVKKTAYESAEEVRMTFLGFVAFLDPAKKTVGATLARMQEYGITIKIITGDNDLVTRKIASDIDLEIKGLITGQQLDKLNDLELAEEVEKVTVFARTNPEQKLRIIEALRKNGHVVGYLGDGINDAPSLKAADIGISVNNAVDVAKQAADFILLHKSLADLVDGVIEGRKTFANTLKYMMMDLSSNFGNMFSMAGASLILPFLPMRATQILLNNLLYDSSQFTLPLDNVDEDFVRRPHKLSIRGVQNFMLVFGPISSLFDFVTFGALYFWLHLSGGYFQTGWFVESMATQILVVFLIRTRRIPFWASRPRVWLGVSAFSALIAAIWTAGPPLAHYFGFKPLPLAAYSAIALITVAYLLMVEGLKAVFYRRFSLDQIKEPKTSPA